MKISQGFLLALPLLVAILLVAPLLGAHAWRVSCPLSTKTPGRLISEMQTVLQKEKVPAFSFGRKDADGRLDIFVYKSGNSVNVKFNLITESVFLPVGRTINFGPKGATGPPLFLIPGIPTMKWRHDGPKYWTTGWIMDAQNVPTLIDKNVTVAQTLERMDANPGAYYAVISSPINVLGIVRGQFRRDFFLSCRQGA